MLKCFSLKGSGGIKIFEQMHVLSRVHLFATPWTAACQALFCPWDSPSKNTGVDSHFLLQGIFQTQGSNLHLFCLLQWQEGSLQLMSTRKLGEKKHEIFLFFFCKHFTSERLSFCQILPQKVLLPARFYLRNSFCEILSQILLLTVRFLPQNHLVSVRFYQRPLVSVRFYLITFIFLTDLTPECSSFCQSLPQTHMSCQILSQKPLLCVRFYL